MRQLIVLRDIVGPSYLQEFESRLDDLRAYLLDPRDVDVLLVGIGELALATEETIAELLLVEPEAEGSKEGKLTPLP